MKCSKMELESAIGGIFPQTLKIVGFNIPTWLKDVAVQFFIEQFEVQDRRDHVRMGAYALCHIALLELHTKGQMSFDETIDKVKGKYYE